MITMPLAGCIDIDEDSSDTPDAELSDWNVHFAATVADLPTCDEDTNGRLYYVEADNQFQVCKTTGWEVIAIQGTDGTDGMNGADGAPGADGQDGTSILINAKTSTCANGGNAFDIGEDTNSNGVLDASEVVISVDICNGADGAQGPIGPQGPAGNDGAQGPMGPQGPAGVDGEDGVDGVDGDHGDDGEDGVDGDHGDDGQDGAQGPQGPAGNDGADGQDGSNGQDGATALIETSTEPAGANCANGGVKIEAGVDDNDNGQLDSNEVDSTQYICDGGSSATTMLTSYSTPPTSMGCDIGGSVIAHGLDNGDGSGTAANGQLESGEVDYSTTFCTKSIMLRIDIYSGSGSSSPSYLTVFNNELYFNAYDGTNGYELWKYDGTNAPSMVADINSGSGSSSPSRLTVLNNELYFRASDGTYGYELWKYTQQTTITYA